MVFGWCWPFIFLFSAHHKVWPSARISRHDRWHVASLPAGRAELAALFLGSGYWHNPGRWDGLRKDCADCCLPLLTLQRGVWGEGGFMVSLIEVRGCHFESRTHQWLYKFNQHGWPFHIWIGSRKWCLPSAGSVAVCKHLFRPHTGDRCGCHLYTQYPKVLNCIVSLFLVLA